MVDCKKFGFKNYDKMSRGRVAPPEEIKDFPKPECSTHLVVEDFNQSIESVYFWLLTSLREDWGLPDVKKVKDIFTASEQSAFWGQAQQRLTIHQGQVSNYLATIGKMTRELFPIIREIRIIEERLELYNESDKAIARGGDVRDGKARKLSQAAEVTLRSYWVDLKDGGVKSPGSVYGLGSSLGYTALPDLFFAAPAMAHVEVDKYVDQLKFNTKLKDVLRRKLKAYCIWKEHTKKESTTRFNLMKKIMKQNYNSIQMYISWIKPFLRNVKRLSMNMEKTLSEDLIGAFEGSVTEIEIICYKKSGSDDPESKEHFQPIVILTMDFRTSPKMDYHQDGYQHKGPVHVGRCEFSLRGYAWSNKELSNYIEMRESESLEMLGDIDKSLKETLDTLGGDIKKYLNEKGEKTVEDEKEEADEKKKESAKEKISTTAEPFIAVFGGFKDMFEALNPIQFSKKPKGQKKDWELKKARGKCMTPMNLALWNTYKNFKKSRKMVTW